MINEAGRNEGSGFFQVVTRFYIGLFFILFNGEASFTKRLQFFPPPFPDNIDYF